MTGTCFPCAPKPNKAIHDRHTCIVFCDCFLVQFFVVVHSAFFLAVPLTLSTGHRAFSLFCSYGFFPRLDRKPRQIIARILQVAEHCALWLRLIRLVQDLLRERLRNKSFSLFLNFSEELIQIANIVQQRGFFSPSSRSNVGAP